MPDGRSGRLIGKTALITGGGRGIGRAVALGYAREGARVAVIARSVDQIDAVATEIRNQGGQALAIGADVSSEADVRAAVNRVTSALGPIDILVNNAARITPGGLAWEVDPDDWLKTIDINLGGTVRMCRAIVPGMIERRQGKVINVSSGAGESVMLNWSAYCASKAAITHFTRCLAAEAKPFGVNVNAVGVYAETQLWWDQIETGQRGGAHPQNLKRQVDEGMAPGPEQNVPVMLFLATSESDRLTGAYISANSMAPSAGANRR